MKEINNREQIIKQIQALPTEEVKLTVMKDLCEKSFYHFVIYCTKNVYKNVKWTYPPFYRYVCDRLQWYFENYLEGKDKTLDLIITLPYRSGKSTILECYKAWGWARKLNLDFLSVSATSPLALKSNRKVKNIIESQWYKSMWDVRFAKDQRAKGAYNNQSNGSMIAVGVNTSAVGKDSSILIVDDPNEPKPKTASSVAVNNVIDRFRDTLYSRLNEPTKGYRVICQQRVNILDLTGWLLKNVPNTVENICLPVEWNEFASKHLRHLYDEDGYLWRERYTPEYLAEVSKVLSANAVASQLYASPTAIEGSAILRSWFESIDDIRFKKLGVGKNILFIDGAFTKDKENNDPSAYYICTLINKRIYIIDAHDDWLEWYEGIEYIKNLISKYNIKEIYIEKKAQGLSLIQELRRQLPRMSVLGVDPGKRSKTDRITICQPYLKNHNIIICEGQWNNKFLEQCARFTSDTTGGKKKHDDMVDCLAYSIIVLLISRYSVKSIKEAGQNLLNNEIIADKKVVYNSDKPNQNYYD